MQQELEQQQQTSLDGFGDNTFVDCATNIRHNVSDTSNYNNYKANIIRSNFIKGSHLDIKQAHPTTMDTTNTPYATDGNYQAMEANVGNNRHKHFGVNLRITGQCNQGGRKYMEDYFSVAYQKTESKRDLEYAFIGIYDGHGGSEAATYAKEHLMMEIINQKLFWSDSDQDVLRSIREGYIATHYAMWREQENWPKTGNGLLSTAGTTATVAFIRKEKIYIGHVGDSGIVLGYQNPDENFWRAKQLTTDHKPESPVERRRIMRAGGKVGVKSGVPRVVWNRPRNAGHRGPIRANTPIDEIPFLAVARSLGDLWSFNAELNEFVVSPDPDVQVVEINPQTFRCLIFGTDGLWNVVSPHEAVETVFRNESINDRLKAQAQRLAKEKNSSQESPQWTNPSKELVEQAIRTWSEKKMRADNTSVVTVILYPPPADFKNDQSINYKNVHDIDFSTFLQDEASFQEIADKYLPPERFQNIHTIPNFDNDHMYWSQIEPNVVREHNWLWRGEVDIELEENDVDEETALEDARKVAQSLQSFNEMLKPLTPYNNCLDTTTDHVESSEKLESTDNSDLYVNSFAETYNSLLDAQISRTDKERPAVNASVTPTPTPTSIPSSSGLQMQEILQEQEMYQQQCMSGEDGYMLTKLETRREQQRCGGTPQTFKVFEPLQEDGSYITTNLQLEVPEESFLVTGIESKEFRTYERMRRSTSPKQREQTENVIKSKEIEETNDTAEANRLLELNSLLQQERAEEQQVAFEYEQLQQHQHQQQETDEQEHVKNYEEYVQPQTSDQKLPEEAENVDNFVEEICDEEKNCDKGVTPNLFIEKSEEEEIPKNTEPILQSKPILPSTTSTPPVRKTPVMKYAKEVKSAKILDINSETLETCIEGTALLAPKIEVIDEVDDETPIISSISLPNVKPKTFTTTTTKSAAKSKNDCMSKATKSPYYMPRRPKSALRNNNNNCSNNNSNMRANNTRTTSQVQFPNIPNENQRNATATAAAEAAATTTATPANGSSATSSSSANSGNSNTEEPRQLRSGNQAAGKRVPNNNTRKGNMGPRRNMPSRSSVPNVNNMDDFAHFVNFLNMANCANLLDKCFADYCKSVLRGRKNVSKELIDKIAAFENLPQHKKQDNIEIGIDLATQFLNSCTGNRATLTTRHVIDLRSRQVNGVSQISAGRINVTRELRSNQTGVSTATADAQTLSAKQIRAATSLMEALRPRGMSTEFVTNAAKRRASIRNATPTTTATMTNNSGASVSSIVKTKATAMSTTSTNTSGRVRYTEIKQTMPTFTPTTAAPGRTVKRTVVEAKNLVDTSPVSSGRTVTRAATTTINMPGTNTVTRIVKRLVPGTNAATTSRTMSAATLTGGRAIKRFATETNNLAAATAPTTSAIVTTTTSGRPVKKVKH